VAPLANAVGPGDGLVAIILAFGPQSGAHMNPILILAVAATEGLRWHQVPPYIAAQILGGIGGPSGDRNRDLEAITRKRGEI